jgi:phosphatidylglycerol:prolipoprotein diacylglycerol transferase
LNFLLNFWQQLPSKLDPVAFSVAGLDIRYYSLGYIIAFALSFILIKYRLQTESRFQDIPKEKVEDFFLWCLLAVVLGGRLGYILFYDLAYYLSNPLQVIIPYDFDAQKFTGISGMSFHGGLIALIITALIYTKVNKIGFWKICDLFIPAIPLGYMFGRIGNFMNNELWGRSTDFVLGMQVKASETFLRHPSQLYEAFAEGLLLFLIFWPIRKLPATKNLFLGMFLVGYGFFRFLIEYVREPDQQIGLLALNLTMGQYLCLGMILAGLVLMYLGKTNQSSLTK